MTCDQAKTAIWDKSTKDNKSKMAELFQHIFACDSCTKEMQRATKQFIGGK